MRFFEFQGDDNGVDKFVMILRNLVGRASSKKAPAKLNWAALSKMAQDTGVELAADYETFKSMYDSNPVIQTLVKNFNDDGVELNVPGAPDSAPTGDGTKGPEDSQAAVDQTAASAAAGQLAQSQSTPQA
jgi:hypothetical protein